MSIYQIIELIKTHPAWFLIAALSIIQIAPIRLDPWTTLFKWIGKIVNGDVRNDIRILSERIAKTEAEEAERNAKTARRSILRAADDIYTGTRHSKEYFEEILAYCDEYDRYCDAHPDFRNGKTHAAEKRIRDIYMKCLETHDFL